MIIKQSKNGKVPLVLLHGWGLNSAVWDFVLADLELYFDVYRVDLPGFGINHGVGPKNYDLATLARVVAPHCPDGCIIAGWSLGGLVGSRIAMDHPQKVRSLCLIASSPCFIEQAQWKGIKPDVLQKFSEQLSVDMEKTVERFLAIQAMGSATARKDVKVLKQAVFDHPRADARALSGGLEILRMSDLRGQLAKLDIPLKGIYGRLDSLVALKSIEQWATGLEHFEYKVVHRASHAPFISHRVEFVDALYEMYREYTGSI